MSTFSYSNDFDEIKNEFQFLNQAGIRHVKRVNSTSARRKFSFLDGFDVSMLPEPPEGCDYWLNFLTSKQYFQYNQKDVKLMIEDRLYFLCDYYKRFKSNQLTKSELNKPLPQDYMGPYLPTPKEVKKIYELEILVDWEVAESHCRNDIEENVYFNAQHMDIMVKNWKEFQKKYKVYDLRPLLGIRSCIVRENEDCDYEFHLYKLLNPTQFRYFILFLGKGLDNISYRRIKKHAAALCDNYWEGDYCFRPYLTLNGLEIHSMEVISEKFPELHPTALMSVLIGKRNRNKYIFPNKNVLHFRHIPFQDGPWSKEHDLLLISSILKCSDEKTLLEMATNKHRYPWSRIMQNVKIRHYNSLPARWNFLKQFVIDILLKKKTSYIDEWTSDHTIRLIEIVYGMDIESRMEIDWSKLVSEHFPGFADKAVRNVFYDLYKTRVPNAKFHYFDEAMEYLYHKVRPVYKLRSYKHSIRTKTFESVYHILNDVENKRQLENFLFENENDSEDDALFLQDEESDCNIGRRKDTQSNSDVLSTPTTTSAEREEEVSSSEQKMFDVSPEHLDDVLIWTRMMDRSPFKPKILFREWETYEESDCSEETPPAADSTDGSEIFQGDERNRKLLHSQKKLSSKDATKGHVEDGNEILDENPDLFSKEQHGSSDSPHGVYVASKRKRRKRSKGKTNANNHHRKKLRMDKSKTRDYGDIKKQRQLQNECELIENEVSVNERNITSQLISRKRKKKKKWDLSSEVDAGAFILDSPKKVFISPAVPKVECDNVYVHSNRKKRKRLKETVDNHRKKKRRKKNKGYGDSKEDYTQTSFLMVPGDLCSAKKRKKSKKVKIRKDHPPPYAVCLKRKRKKNRKAALANISAEFIRK